MAESSRTSAAARCARDLGVLLRHEREAPERPLLEALLVSRCWGDQEPRAAAARLLDHHAPWGTDLGPGEEFLLGTPSSLQSALFVEILMGGEDCTLEAVGRARGVSGAAVSDAVRRAGRKIRAALEHAPPPWPWLVAELRRRLGAVTSEALVGDVLGQLGAPPGSVAAALATWLAGPLRPVRGCPGWLARDPGVLRKRSSHCVQADGGVRRLADVEQELADLELAPGMLVPWLHAFGAVVIHDLVVATAGLLPDVVERLLDAYGTPRSVAQVAQDLEAGGRVVDQAALVATVAGRRFRSASDGSVGLCAWGDLDTAPSRLSEPSSGRRRHGTGCSRSAGPTEGTAAAAHQQLWIQVGIDEAVLRGEEAAVPVELVDWLGLDVHARRTFSCRWGPVTLAYEGPHPTRGSLRAVARAAGAQLGDTLLLGFSRTGELAVELRAVPQTAPGDG